MPIRRSNSAIAVRADDIVPNATAMETDPSAGAGVELNLFDDQLDEIAGDDGITFELTDDGTLTEFGVDGSDLELAGQHAQNLADVLDDAYLNRLGGEIIAKVEADIEARQPWVDRFTRGMGMMGLVDDEIDDGPFPGASTAVLPLLSEAQTAFWARAYPELMPSEGPAKATVIGAQDNALTARADRVKDFLNYEMLFMDRSYSAETSRLVSAVPIQGCAFRKTYYDKLRGHTVGIFVPAEDLIVPGEATDLHSTPHFTHRFYRTQNEMRKLQVGGVYRDCDLQEPSAAGDNEIKLLKDEVSDIERGTSHDTSLEPHELFEYYCTLDLPGFEDTYPGAGQPTGIELEYVVTVERYSGKVLSIYRNWRENDPRKARRLYFTKYEYLPGSGFYSHGLFHLLGGLQEAATGALRSMLDGAAMASLQGGFVAKDANIKNERLVVEPGVWKPIESTSEEFSKAFLTPPYKEPSPVLYQMIGLLSDAAQRFTSTTNAMVGDGKQNAPVGTTLALLEQGHKVYSAIHRGLHASLSEELRIRAELAAENIPAGGYPYDQEGVPRTIYAEDFGGGVAIQPVSDPNIFSTTQRLQIAQAVLQTADSHPDLLDRKVAMRRYLEAMKVPNISELMAPVDDPQPMDPVSEAQMMLRQKPVKAFPEQDHMAHIAVHMQFMQHPGFGGNPSVGQALGAAMQAHIGEHLGYLYASYARMGGIPAPMLDPITGLPSQPEIPPEAIAQMAAQMGAQFMQMPGLPPPPEQAQAPPPEPRAGGAAESPEITQAKVASITATTQAKIASAQATTEAKLQANAAEAQLKLQQKVDENTVKMQDREHKAAIDQEQRFIEAQQRAVKRQMDQQSAQAIREEALRSAMLEAMAKQKPIVTET